MKISKTAVLALGGVFLTAGLGLMVVNAATVEQYKDLLLDLNNAVQHFDTVRFINGSGTSKVDLKRIGSNNDPLLGISLNNLIITESGSVSDENKIEHVSNSSILGGKKNQIKGGGTGKNVILGGEGNTINAGGRDVILGGSGNEISNNVIRGVILGGEGNKVKGSMSTNIGNKNVIGGQASVAVGRNNVVNGSNSAALGVSGTVSKDSSFLWTDKSFEVNKDNVFVVNGENGMVIGGNKAHSLAKLTISGSLFIGIQNTDTCNPSYKGAIKIMNGRNSGKCFCSCNGSGWSSLNGKGSCIDVCASANNRMFPVCGSDTTCNRSDISYQGSCEVGQLVQGEGAHFIDKDNLLHWKCMTDNGAITPCTGSIPLGCPSSHVGASCGGSPNTCSEGVPVPNADDTGYETGHVWPDGIYRWLCKNGADDPIVCNSSEVCDLTGFKLDQPDSGCLNGSHRIHPDPDFNGVALNLRWTCELDGRRQICRKDAAVQCNWHETVQKLDELQADPYFNDNRCLAGHADGGEIDAVAGTYKWKCIEGSLTKSCYLFLYPKCGTTVNQCEIGTSSSLPGGWKCTNSTVSVSCPSNEELVNTGYNCKSPHGSGVVVYDLSNSNKTWEQVQPTSGDLVRECYDSRPTHSGTPTDHTCQFECKPGFYCTDLDYRASCAKPKCVGGDDLGDHAQKREKPGIDHDDLDPVYLDEEYKFWTGSLVGNSPVWNSAEGCYYRCPLANQYEDPISGKIRCYSTGEVARLRSENTNTGACAQEIHLGYYHEEPGFPTGGIVNWKYIPRYGGTERDEAGNACRWTCEQGVPNGFDTYLSTNVFVDEDVSGVGDLKNSIEFGGAKDCRRKCNEGQIYTSVNRCHSCPQDKIPDPNRVYEFTNDNGDVSYKQPYSCIGYTCPSNYELDTSSYDSNVKTYKSCVCKGNSSEECKVINYKYGRRFVSGKYKVCVDIDGVSWVPSEWGWACIPA